MGRPSPAPEQEDAVTAGHGHAWPSGRDTRKWRKLYPQATVRKRDARRRLQVEIGAAAVGREMVRRGVSARVLLFLPPQPQPPPPPPHACASV